jgi:hypothetical protein
MYSSDEDIFAEKEPEEKKELITEFNTENSFGDKKNTNVKDIKENSEKINIKGNSKTENMRDNLSNKNHTDQNENKNNVEKSQEANYLDADNKEEIIDENNNIKPKRKIHISVVVDNKKSENQKKNGKGESNNYQKPEDILKRSKLNLKIYNYKF